MSGSFQSVRGSACEHKLDLGLYSHLKEFGRERGQNPCQIQGKNPPYPRFRGGTNPASRRTTPQVHTLLIRKSFLGNGVITRFLFSLTL